MACYRDGQAGGGYRGWWGQVGGGGGWVGSQRQIKAFIMTDISAVSSVSDRNRLNPQDKWR